MTNSVLQVVEQLKKISAALRKGDRSATKQLKQCLSSLPPCSDAYLLVDWASAISAKRKCLTSSVMITGVCQMVQRFPDTPIADWGREQIRAITRTHHRVRTQRSRLTACRLLLHHCQKTRKIKLAHWRIWRNARPLIPLQNVEVLTFHEVNVLIQWLGHRSRNGLALVVAAILAAFWGLRATEIASLTLGDVIIGRTLVCVVQGKFGKLRQVPNISVPDWVSDILSKWWMQRSSELSGNMSKSLLGLSAKTIEMHIGRGLKMRTTHTRPIGIEHVELADSAHHLRHWFANRLFLTALPISEIARLLGHASPRTTVRSYLHVVKPRKKSPNLGRPVSNDIHVAVCSGMLGLTVRQMRNVLTANNITSLNAFVPTADLTRLMNWMLSAQQQESCNHPESKRG